MAKPKTEPSAAAKALLDARQKHEVASEAHKNKPTATTEKAVNETKATVVAAQEADSRDRFVRIGTARVKTARAKIKNIAGLAAPRSYSYNGKDVDSIEKALTEMVTKTVSKMRDALAKGPTVAKSDDDFSIA